MSRLSFFTNVCIAGVRVCECVSVRGCVYVFACVRLCVCVHVRACVCACVLNIFLFSPLPLISLMESSSTFVAEKEKKDTREKT